MDSKLDTKNLSRRQALKLLMGASALAAANPTFAFADTQSELDAAQAKLAEFDAQLTAIGNEYEAMAQKQAQTLDDIEATQGQIDDTQGQIDAKQAELEQKQQVLGKRISSAYKAGNQGILEMLLSSATFEELTSNVYYLDKVNESDAQIIQQVHEVKNTLDSKKAELVTQKGELETLSLQQQSQLADMQAKQEEMRASYDSLSAEVKALVDQRNAELAAQAAEAERQRQAAAAAASSSSNRGGSAYTNGGAVPVPSGNGSLSRVISSCNSTPSPGPGLCAMWVSQVFSRAGFGYASGNANDMYNSWCYSSDRSQLQPGMIVAVSTHSHTSAGRIYGHIGIYVGNGLIMDNIGRVNTQSLDSWIAYYGTTVSVRWGWLMGIQLS